MNNPTKLPKKALPTAAQMRQIKKDVQLQRQKETSQTSCKAVSGTKTVNIDGLTCKIGLNGKVFYLTNGEWRLSTKTPEQILNAIKKGA